MTAADARTVLRDYDLRNNRAIVRSAVYDASGWAAADSGALLAADAFRTTAARLDHLKGDPRPVTHQLVRSWIGADDGQGAWMLAQFSEPVKGSGPADLGGFDANAAGLTGWRLSSDVATFDVARLPAPLSRPAASTTAQRSRAAVVAGQVATSVETGDRAAFGYVYSTFPTLLQRFDSGIETRTTYRCYVFGSHTDRATTTSLAGTPSLRMLRAQQATVAVVTLDCDTTLASPGHRYVYDSPGEAAALEHRFVPVATLAVPKALQVLVVIPDTGRPSIVAADESTVFARSRR